MAVKFEMTSDFSRVFADYDKLQRAVVRLEQANRKLVDQSKQKDQVESDGFDKLQSRIATAIGGFVSLGAAIGIAKDAFAFMKSETDAAFESMTRLSDARGKLAQVGTSAQDMSDLQQKADQLSATFAVDRETTRQLLFDARSLGFEDVTPTILKSKALFDIQAASTVAGKLPAIFQRTVSPEQALNVAYEAAKTSVADVGDFGRSLPVAAEGMAMAGATMEETSAAFASLSDQFGTIATAAERLKTFGVKLGLDKRFTGTFTQRFEQFSALPETDRAEFLKTDQETNIAFSKLTKNWADIKKRTAELQRVRMQAGTDQAPLQIAAAQFYDPTTAMGRLNRAQFEADRARIARDVVREERFGVGGAEIKAAQDIAQTELDRQKAGMIAKFGAKVVGATAEEVGLQQLMPAGAVGFGAGIATSGRTIESFIKRGPFGPLMMGAAAITERTTGVNLANPFPSPDATGEAAKQTDYLREIDRTLKHSRGTPTATPGGGTSAVAAAQLHQQREGR